MQNQMIRAYKDGNRLVIVIENADTTMHKLVETMLACTVKPVEYLEPETDTMPAPVDTTRMEPVKAPRFVRKAEEMRTVEPAKRAAKPAGTSVRQEKPDVSAAAEKPAETKKGTRKPISRMNIFEIRDYLVSKKTDERLKELIKEQFRTENLDFVLYTKSERDLKDVAYKLAG